MKNVLELKRLTILLSVATMVGSVLLVSCKKDNNEDSGKLDVMFSVPAELSIEDGASTLDFRIQFNKAPKLTDKVVFEDVSKAQHSCNILSLNEKKSFTVELFSGLTSGSYDVYIQRGSKSKLMGSTTVTITGGGVEPESGSTVYGKVSCDGEAVSGVVISDGYEVVKTDSKGVYQLKSQKKNGYVFMSVPSGYEPLNNGILPIIHTALKKSATVAERVDFTLNKVSDQDNYTVFFLGDMHLANRTDDRTQFTAFTNDLNTYMDSHKSQKMYAITLGDMTWDLYWRSNSYEFPQYLQDINSRVSGILIYHTMGNHDNDMLAVKSNFDAKFEYTTDIAPNYYSFNIGKIHYVVLDDIDCSQYDGTASRNYVKRFTQEQIDWLEKDLSYVPKTTPLIIITHAQIFYPNGTNTFKWDNNESTRVAVMNLVKDYKVNFVTGHTHTIFNANPAETKSLTGGSSVYEHNAGSVCASWWWSGSLTKNVYVSLDGAPGGYSIWNITGTDIKWKYKATAKTEDYQFRSYDLNNVSFSFDDISNLYNDSRALTDETKAALLASFARYTAAYPKNSNNKVLINIWNWNSNWKLSVTDESGKELSYTKSVGYDPLHIKALSVRRFNKANLKDTPSFITESSMPHFFTVTASDANVDLTIKVTDEFGNVYTEKMARPKQFDTLTDAQLAEY